MWTDIYIPWIQSLLKCGGSKLLLFFMLHLHGGGGGGDDVMIFSYTIMLSLSGHALWGWAPV